MPATVTESMEHGAESMGHKAETKEGYEQEMFRRLSTFEKIPIRKKEGGTIGIIKRIRAWFDKKLSKFYCWLTWPR